VCANLVYRDFTHVGGGKMPDAKTMGRWGLALGPQVLKHIHERIVKIAQAKGVIAGRRMRVDTTVVETDIHDPTDSTLLGDGVRVLTRIMRKITKIAGAAGTKLRDRSRSVKFRLLEIGRVARAKGPINQDKLKQRYRQLLNTTSRVVGQAKRFDRRLVTFLTEPEISALLAAPDLSTWTGRRDHALQSRRPDGPASIGADRPSMCRCPSRSRRTCELPRKRTKAADHSTHVGLGQHPARLACRARRSAWGSSLRDALRQSAQSRRSRT